MQPLLVLPLIAFLILLTLFVLVLRRAGRFLAATRDVERFRRQAGELASRVETSLGELSERVDALRRGQLGVDAVAVDIATALEAVGRYTDEARAFRPPRDGLPIRDDIIAELERTARAIEMIEHGRSIQASARSGGRAVESQTAIKRGYLNVLHAREAIAHQAGLAERLSPGGGIDRFQRRDA